jgi:hypothetical protein
VLKVLGHALRTLDSAREKQLSLRRIRNRITIVHFELTTLSALETGDAELDTELESRSETLSHSEK